MTFTVLPSQLHTIAEAANTVIKSRYGLGDGLIEEEIHPDIPFRPTLHWKTKTGFIACEVAERPCPTSIKEVFTDIVASGQPLRILVAYPRSNDISSAEYQKEIKLLKRLGIGFLSIEENGRGEIEYHGVSLASRIDPIELRDFPQVLKPLIADAFEHYMSKGDPDVGLQKIGQLTETAVLNVARQAKAAGNFTFAGFRPPRHIPFRNLLDEMINENILDVAILGRCKSFAEARNGVSHRPTSRKQAMEIQRKLRENFFIGIGILRDLPPVIKLQGYRLRV